MQDLHALHFRQYFAPLLGALADEVFMRGPFDSMLRWFRESNGQANGNAHLPEPPPHDPQPAIEPPWLAQLDKEGIPRNLRYPTTTLGRIIDQAAERFGDNPALIYNHETWTYRQLLARVNRLAGGLARLDVRSGDRVLLALPNCPEYILAFFAVQKLGAVVVNAGPLVGADDLRRLMTMTTPRVVIALDLLASKIINALNGSPPEHIVWITLQCYQTLIQRMGYQIKLWQTREHSNGSPIRHTTLSKLLENAPSRPPTVEPSPQTLALLQPTSGTTGLVKLVELTHANLLANATQISAWMSIRDGQESVLSVLADVSCLWPDDRPDQPTGLRCNHYPDDPLRGPRGAGCARWGASQHLPTGAGHLRCDQQ